MITQDNLYVSDESRERLISGIKKSALAVGGTMGTGGSNCLIEAIESPGHLTTNDGATILGSIRFKDTLEEMGRKILLEAVSRANKQSGDGSSTTTVLTAAIIEAGKSYLDRFSAMDIKRSLEACIPEIEAIIKANTKDITVDEVGNVASISAEDPNVGALIQEIYQQIGKDGIIHWDISKTTEDSYTIGNGITINGASYLSPYMCDIDEKTGQFLNVARWKNVTVLLVKQKITSAADFSSLFKTLHDKSINEVVVFCDEIEATVIPDLIKTRAVRGFKTLVVKMPVIWKDQWYEDLAIASGATVIDPALGVNLKNMNESHLGHFDNIVVGREDTFIDGIQPLDDHLEMLREEGSDDSLYRIARLNTRTARLYIGAQSDSALSYKRLKVEDAISAAYQALQGGVVPGGGVAMIQVAKKLSGSVIGEEILSQALLAPAEQIAKNVGVKPDWSMYQGNTGLNSKTQEYTDMLEANIVNPAIVELNAIRNAISVAASILTTNAIITLPEVDERLGQ